MKRHVLITAFSLVLALGLSARAALTETTGPSAASDADWASGDLTGADGEGISLELDDLGLDAPRLLYRATGPRQLEAHARKRVQILVRKSMTERGYQYLTVHVDGSLQYDAPVSTAWERLAPGKTGSYQASTPPGKFIPDGMQPKRFSNRWQVWLQHVIRFNSGIWIHATTPDHFLELGAPASGGCVRLHPSDAREVYEIVEKYGLNETAITVLQHDPSEKQVPWKLQPSKQIPTELQHWRSRNSVM